jgi:hypothetical protein
LNQCRSYPFFAFLLLLNSIINYSNNYLKFKIVNVFITYMLTLLINELQHLAIHGLFLYSWMVFYINCCNYFNIFFTLFQIRSLFVLLNDLSIFSFLFQIFTSYVLVFITHYGVLGYTIHQSYLSVKNSSVSFLILCQVLQVLFSFPICIILFSFCTYISFMR